MLLATFDAGESIYVHCMAGRHRAPLPAAALRGLCTCENFDTAIAFIQSIRDIEPDKMFRDNRNRQVAPFCSAHPLVTSPLACGVLWYLVRMANQFSHLVNGVKHLAKPRARAADVDPGQAQVCAMCCQYASRNPGYPQ